MKKKQQKPKTIDNDTSSCPIERASSSWQPVAGTLCEFRNKFLYLVLCLVALKSFFFFFFFCICALMTFTILAESQAQQQLVKLENNLS